MEAFLVRVCAGVTCLRGKDVNNAHFRATPRPSVDKSHKSDISLTRNESS